MMKNLLYILIPIVLGITSLAIAIVLRFRSKGRDFTSYQLKSLPLNDRMSKEYASYAIKRLLEFAKAIKPDGIIGINRGGVMIGAYMALSLNISKEKFARCMVPDDENKVVCENPDMSGTILIVDDICRSGRTLDLARKFYLEKYKDIERIFFAVMVTVADKNNIPPFSHLSFYVYKTDNMGYLLPWTSKLRSEIARAKQSGDLLKTIKSISVENLADEMSKEVKMHF